MDYSRADIEDQIIATLRASAASSTNGLYGTQNIKTHAGRISIQLFENPQYYEGLLALLPFVFVRFEGRIGKMDDAVGKIWRHTLQWTIYVGAKSLRKTQESQRDAYSMLDGVWDSIAGRWPNATSVPSALDKLGGTAINMTTYPNFKALTSILEAGGQDEKLVVELPTIAVYQTTYQLSMLAGR